ncbi:phosphonate ABC transporter ATP-binding protein [Mycoplasma mycoides]|uniref:Alkylphosphonate ABC transporter ATP-binding protein n=1 Tax=Mycoplasma mycoides subsp. capri TaxID=40477 RepID=A0AB38GF22_MYCMC|nr:ATP-binding cassette domain-containing protein [Mycoplasma mycoides]ADH21644.1 alkylphosphonate ABC transporter, ATP-binding component [synthetic Mycoplasma mycoides JCVI-syn1.0]AMW76637.1 ABC transporter, ATP-binding protein [synthetic bacterium JCVI-Syn3.0]AMW77110.1 ABC transporter, ATP-binding protein [synthetic bacterium JCVI-Syn2.0]AVX54937.1 Thiamine ABC transporter ATP-binding protein [synthetic bacterium JCVI-Syn3A]QWN46173.1 ATP-binding cassette domain-containing protein [syntheti
MNKVIELKEISVQYNNRSDLVLKDINLDIFQGELVAIIGPSGVGKSTLFKIIINSLRPVKGQVKVFDKDILKFNKKQKRLFISKIGFLTQTPNLIYTDNVYNNIIRSTSKYKNNFYKFFSILTRKQKITIFEKLDELNILDKAFFKVSELSGGQQQRVEIAKLLIKDVELILADEPTSNLDKKTSIEVLKVLKNISKQNKTILVNIHDLSLVKRYFDRVIAINNKQIVFDKKTKDIKQWQLDRIIKSRS